MMIRHASAVAAVVLLAAVAEAQTVTDPNVTVTPFDSGFNQPTQIRFLGSNDLFVTEKNTGRVIRSNGGTKTTALDLNVANDSERGLLGLTLDPNFGANNFVYVYYSATSGGDGGAWTENRLSRFVWNGTTLGSETPLRTFGTAADGQANGPNHNAGPILFGPDGRLYGTTGDLNRNAAEQNNNATPNTTARVGGLYRLNADGSIPGDNPFLASPNADFHQWYAYGVRNTFGIAFDPLTGNLWDTENGPNVFDEINLVAPGFNSGWNQIMGPDARDPQGLGDLVNLPGSAYSDPEFSFLAPVGITGLNFLANSALDANYRDALLAGDINNGNLYLLRLNATRDGFVLSGGLADLVADDLAERNAVRFGQGFAGVTDIQIGPDGAAYVTSLGAGIIYRLAPIPEPTSIVLLLAGGGCVLGAVRTARRGRVHRAS